MNRWSKLSYTDCVCCVYCAFQELELSIASLLAEVREDEIREMQTSMTPEMAIVYAVLYIIAGVAVAGFAAIPTVGVIGDFSKAAGVDPFIVSFVAAPLILNLSEGIKTISSAGKRGKLHITTVFAEVSRWHCSFRSGSKLHAFQYLSDRYILTPCSPSIALSCGNRPTDG